MNVALVANREALGRFNYLTLQAALTAQTPITLPAGDIYLDAGDDGPLVTPATVSCGLIDVRQEILSELRGLRQEIKPK